LIVDGGTGSNNEYDEGSTFFSGKPTFGFEIAGPIGACERVGVAAVLTKSQVQKRFQIP